MGIIDFILNWACLLLWLSWRSLSFDPLAKARPASIASTLKRTEPQRFARWHFLAALAALLLIRAVLYWQIGPAVDWVPNLQLGAISVFFRSDVLRRMLLFSALSFLLTLTVFYTWLLFLAVVNRKATEPDPIQRLVRLHLGWLDRWPWPVQLLVPLVLASVAWLALAPVLAALNLIQPPLSLAHRIEQAIVIGLGTYLTWKYVLAAFLLLWLLTAYVYFGNHAFWNFVGLTGRNLLQPLRMLPLRVGRVDLAPILEIALVFLAAELAQRGLTILYRRLPL